MKEGRKERGEGGKGRRRGEGGKGRRRGGDKERA